MFYSGSFVLTMSSTRKSVDNPTVPKKLRTKYPNKTYTQESPSTEDY